MIWAIIVVMIVLLDQITKKIVEQMLTSDIELIPQVFHITYETNDGASWGMFSGGRWFFVVLTVAVIVGVLIWLYKKKPTNKLLLTGISLVMGGAVGNLIDRILYGKVTDFFDFCLIDFPIFNIADIGITIGTVLLCIYIFFFSQEKEGGETDAE